MDPHPWLHMYTHVYSPGYICTHPWLHIYTSLITHVHTPWLHMDNIIILESHEPHVWTNLSSGPTPIYTPSRVSLVDPHPYTHLLVSL